jgi:DNA-binding NarL/FixJ family response regulator
MAACLAAGALGYVTKILMPTDLIPAIHEALAGRVFVSSFSSQREALPARLVNAEHEINAAVRCCPGRSGPRSDGHSVLIRPTS